MPMRNVNCIGMRVKELPRTFTQVSVLKLEATLQLRQSERTEPPSRGRWNGVKCQLVILC